MIRAFRTLRKALFSELVYGLCGGGMVSLSFFAVSPPCGTLRHTILSSPDTENPVESIAARPSTLSISSPSCS